jgi:hypothetical protein
MSRRVMPFQGACHDDAEWTCLACGRVICGVCEPSPLEFELCGECFWIADDGSGGAA